MNKNHLQLVEQDQQVRAVQYQSYVPTVEVTPQQAKEHVRKLDEIKRNVLRNKVDYDVIPGTPKPTLLKPGAERLLQFFGLGHKVQCVDKILDWEKGFFYFCYKVTIVKTYPTHEIVVAECEGSCNSKESKYAWRWVNEWDVKAMGLNPQTLPSKTVNGKKKYRVPNDDIYSQVNTIKKMAIKRALVGATLQATGTSEFFTQDVEDLVEPEQPQQENNVVQYTKTNQYKNPKGAFFAEASRWKLTAKQQKAIVFAFTDKESRKDLTEEEYEKLAYFLKNASEEDIRRAISEGAEKKKKMQQEESQVYNVDPETGEVIRFTDDDLDEISAEISEEGK